MPMGSEKCQIRGRLFTMGNFLPLNEGAEITHTGPRENRFWRVRASEKNKESITKYWAFLRIPPIIPFPSDFTKSRSFGISLLIRTCFSH